MFRPRYHVRWRSTSTRIVRSSEAPWASPRALIRRRIRIFWQLLGRGSIECAARPLLDRPIVRYFGEAFSFECGRWVLGSDSGVDNSLGSGRDRDSLLGCESLREDWRWEGRNFGWEWNEMACRIITRSHEWGLKEGKRWKGTVFFLGWFCMSPRGGGDNLVYLWFEAFKAEVLIAFLFILHIWQGFINSIEND